MAKVEIIITQSPHGSSPAGVAKRDLDLYSVGSQAIVFTNSTDGDVGVSKWEWTLVERPPGSSASLTGADTASAELQADVEGRYVVSLRVNDLGDDTPGYGVTVAGVSFASLGAASGGGNLGDWDLPAFHEGTYANWTDAYGPLNEFGAQRELFRILKQIREDVLPNVGGGGDGAIHFPLSGALTQRSDQSTWADAAILRGINMDDLSFNNIYFGATAQRTGSTGTLEVRLYDVTNAVVITSSTLNSFTPGAPDDDKSVALTVGSSAGNMRDDGDTIYKVQIRITGGTPGVDFINLYDAWLELEQ